MLSLRVLLWRRYSDLRVQGCCPGNSFDSCLFHSVGDICTVWPFEGGPGLVLQYGSSQAILSSVELDVSSSPGRVDNGHEDTKGLIEVSRRNPDDCSTPQQQ
jgi:hypothetical protein